MPWLKHCCIGSLRYHPTWDRCDGEVIDVSNFPPGEVFLSNIELVGYTDLAGRPSFKLALHKADDRWFLYAPTLWHSGLNIVEVTEPNQPRFVRFVPGPPNTWTLQVQIAEGHMITSMERIPPGWGGVLDAPYDEGFLIWDLANAEVPKSARPF